MLLRTKLLLLALVVSTAPLSAETEWEKFNQTQLAEMRVAVVFASLVCNLEISRKFYWHMRSNYISGSDRYNSAARDRALENFFRFDKIENFCDSSVQRWGPANKITGTVYSSSRFAIAKPPPGVFRKFNQSTATALALDEQPLEEFGIISGYLDVVADICHTYLVGGLESRPRRYFTDNDVFLKHMAFIGYGSAAAYETLLSLRRVDLFCLDSFRRFSKFGIRMKNLPPVAGKSMQ